MRVLFGMLQGGINTSPCVGSSMQRHAPVCASAHVVVSMCRCVRCLHFVYFHPLNEMIRSSPMSRKKKSNIPRFFCP